MKKDEIVRALRQRHTELSGELKGIDAALVALNGQPATKQAEVVKRRRPARRKRRSLDSRKKEVLEGIRLQPQRSWSRADLARQFDIPPTTATFLVDELIKDGSVALVGETSRKSPVVVYRPTDIRVGEGVVS